LHQDPAVLAAFGAEPQTETETREWLEHKLAHWREHGFGIWMFRDAEGAFIGRCGIHRWRGEVELGYIVRSELWSQGFGTEMASAVAAYAFDAVGVRSLVAFTQAENAGSRRVMQKAGFVYERDFVDHGAVHVLYRLTPAAERAQSG
jgi:[ribosomal protein S5]-alanine N-acetyltransferase